MTKCNVDGCAALVSDGERCPDHGGSPAYAEITDEWGELTVLTGPPSPPPAQSHAHIVTAEGFRDWDD